MDQINGLPGLFPQETLNTSPRKSNDLGQEDFLSLLVAQLKHQDPSKPMDNFQFLSQIAQFGMVDGIQQLQGSFTSVADSFKQGQMMQAASLLGREVLTESNRAILGQGPVEGAIQIPAPASNVLLEIRDVSGSTVFTTQLGVAGQGKQEFRWDGTSNNGEILPAGEYRIHAKGEIEGRVQDFSVHTMNTVASATINAEGQLSLTLATGQEVTLAAVERLK